jgi:hypothetical protein
VGNLASDNLTPQSEAESIGGGALVGGLLPPVAEGAKSLLGKAITRVAQLRDKGVIVPPSALDTAAEATNKAEGKTETKSATPAEPAVPKPTSQVDKIAEATPVARKAGASDEQIKNILEEGVGSNRSEALRVLEKNQDHLTEADRLKLTGGDTGQAGLQMDEAARDALLAKTRAAAAAQMASEAEKGTSKIGASVQERAVQRGLEDHFGESAQYTKASIPDQARRAVALTQDRALLDQVISGEKPLPDGLRATSVITAIEKDPVLSRDPELINRLSASNLASESSYSAQELRLARERNPDSPITNIQDVRKTRESVAEKQLGKPVAKAVKDTVGEIKAATPKVTRQDWQSFIESIKC